jgi:hypothetical protein
MCPRDVCPSHDLFHRTAMHWPAPDAALADAMLVGFEIVALAAALVGLASCGFAIARAALAMVRRRPIELGRTTLVALLGLSVVAALGPAIAAALDAFLLSEESISFCSVLSLESGLDLTKVGRTAAAAILGSIALVVLFAVHTRRGNFAVEEVLDRESPRSYRGAPGRSLRLRDEARSRRIVLRAFAVRSALAAAIVLALSGVADPFDGSPFTIGVFLRCLAALAVLAFHVPTASAVDEPLHRAIRPVPAKAHWTRSAGSTASSP